MIIPIVNASDLTYNINTTSDIDVVNSTYLKNFVYYSVVTNNSASGNPWDFPIIGFLAGIISPFTNGFGGVGVNSGNIIFLVLFGLFALMVWRQSGKITITSMICIVTASAWGMLFPESAQPYILIIMVVAISAQALSWFDKD